LKKKHEGRLDDFYVIIKNQDAVPNPNSAVTKNNSGVVEMHTMIKFKQERAEQQLSLWHELKLYTTSLKFIDYLRENSY
jgi:hypothetical protein|tara:strand:- start:333 stop:569 length:237 start_codon:yes stop_codon:yes gene_type:complete